MGNSFEALFGKGKKDEGEKPAPKEETAGVPEKEGSELEKATAIKKEISEIAQGKNLEDLGVEELKNILSKYREIEKVLEISESGIEGSVAEQIERAREILGDDVFSHQEIEKAFGIKISPENIPEIPFSESDLERARELNQFLILRVDKTNDGKPLTIEKMNELLKGKTKDGEKALYSDDGSGKIKDDAWYKSEDFATKEAPRLSWALVSKEIIPDSADKNYLNQTIEIVNYLKEKVFKGKEMPTEFQVAISEFEKVKAEIAKLIEDDWEKAAEKLEGLAITKLTRQIPAEALYDIFVYFQNKGERLLENMLYTWTLRRGSGGGLVVVGSFDSDGADVRSRGPGSSRGDLGVSFSRSL